MPFFEACIGVVQIIKSKCAYFLDNKIRTHLIHLILPKTHGENKFRLYNLNCISTLNKLVCAMDG